MSPPAEASTGVTAKAAAEERGASSEAGRPSPTTVKRFVSGLNADEPLYQVRARVDPYHVGQLAEVLRSGAELPPIVVEEGTGRVVDGFHRVRAYREVFGKEALVECEERRYGSEGDLLLDAAALNANHGRRLSSFDLARVAELGERLGVDPSRVAKALSVRPDTLKDLKLKRFGTELTTKSPVALKRTIAHMRGKALTKAQMEANRKLGGQNQSFYANQLIILLEADLLNEEDPALMRTIGRLKELLDGVEVLEDAGPAARRHPDHEGVETGCHLNLRG